MEDSDHNNEAFKSPGFILAKDIDSKTNGFNIMIAVEKVIGEENLESIQNVRGVWRLYPNTIQMKIDLCKQGIELNGKKVKVHSQNPFYTNTNSDAKFNPREFVRSTRPDTTRVLIKDVYRSVANSQIKYMLENQYNVRVYSEVKYCYVRNDEHELTHCKNCDRFCYVYSEDLKIPLPRVAKCGEWQCRIFHENQLGPTIKECNNCYQNDHFGRNCPNAKCCRVCKKEGHEPGSSDCDFYEELQDTIAFGGGGEGDIFSNHYPCDFTYKELDFDSTEKCWFFHKAMICMQPKLAKEIYRAHDAKHAKRLSKRIRCAPDWDSSAIGVNLMKDILTAKFTQVEECNQGLKQAFWTNKQLVEAVPTYDKYWGSSMTPEQTLNTKRSKWPGRNKLGDMLEELAVELFGEPTGNVDLHVQSENPENESDMNESTETVPEIEKNEMNVTENVDKTDDELHENVSISDNSNVNDANVSEAEVTATPRPNAKVAQLIAGRRFRSRSPSKKVNGQKSPRSTSVKRSISSPDSLIPQKTQKVVEKNAQDAHKMVKGRTDASSSAAS